MYEWLLAHFQIITQQRQQQQVLSRMKVTDVVHAWQRSIYHIFIRNRDACDPSTMAPSSLKTSTEWSFFCVPTTYRRSKGRGELRHNVLKNLLKRCKLRTFLKKATLFRNNKIYAWWNCLANSRCVIHTSFYSHHDLSRQALIRFYAFWNSLQGDWAFFFFDSYYYTNAADYMMSNMHSGHSTR